MLWGGFNRFDVVTANGRVVEQGPLRIGVNAPPAPANKGRRPGPARPVPPRRRPAPAAAPMAPTGLADRERSVCRVAYLGHDRG